MTLKRSVNLCCHGQAVSDPYTGVRVVLSKRYWSRSRDVHRDIAASCFALAEVQSKPPT
jgi:hypothetical protein